MAEDAEKEREARASEEESGRSSGLLSLWTGVLLAPMAFLSNLQANYTLAQELCPGGHTALLHATTLLFLVIALLGGLLAWRNWVRAGQKWPDESESKAVRNRFMAAVGVMISLLSAVIIIAQWIPQFIFNPCMR